MLKHVLRCLVDACLEEEYDACSSLPQSVSAESEFDAGVRGGSLRKKKHDDGFGEDAARRVFDASKLRVCQSDIRATRRYKK